MPVQAVTAFCRVAANSTRRMVIADIRVGAVVHNGDVSGLMMWNSGVRSITMMVAAEFWAAALIGPIAARHRNRCQRLSTPTSHLVHGVQASLYRKLINNNYDTYTAADKNSTERRPFVKSNQTSIGQLSISGNYHYKAQSAGLSWSTPDIYWTAIDFWQHPPSMVTTSTNSHCPRPAPRHIYSYVAQPHLYSDHYPEHQNKPDGVISIAFSKSTIRSVHTNNDPVRGVVHVKSNIKVKSVSIQFIGRSICRTFEGASQHVSSVDLFRHEMALRQIAIPSENCPAHRVEYPFEFRFPEAVQLPPSIPCPADPKFETEHGHALPPSLWWDENTVRNEYVLEAQFVSEEKHFTMNPKTIHQLRFFPSVPEMGLPIQPPLRPAPPIRLERKARLDESGRGKGTLRRLSQRFTGSTESLHEPPSSDLLILSVPERYRVGSTSTLKISIQTATPTPRTDPAPASRCATQAPPTSRPST
ncbi:hypothetical protein OPT61_g5985 [Boeremia exigua]|uniref:Uncharacterized protein n=1 Tax=Boeremia exigua TaxID=749465 RepID=A0ACC2I8C3_9PLEO|nr:hypothetical protein OPT61_g5985 [Boeremia exigua]